MVSIRRVNSTTNPLSRFLFGRKSDGRVDAASWVLVLASAALLGWKAWAIRTINVNWDEFYFLTHVHALLRGDLDIPFQTTYAQAYRWLRWVGADEMAQIHAARLSMFLLLALAVWQIVRLASRWTSPVAALTAALAFLCLFPTQVHGASFRADSLLLPLLLGVLLLLTRSECRRTTDVLAGVLCGVGLAVSIKMALFAPLFLACVLLIGDATAPMVSRLRAAAMRCVVIGAVTLAVAAMLIGLHQLTLQSAGLESASSFADRSLGKTILETRFLPREDYLRHLLRVDRFIWILLAVGLALSLARRRWLPALMALAVSPVLFYRNAFPYFFVDMLAPAVILIAVVVDEVRALARRNAAASRREWVPVACGVVLLAQGAIRLPLMSWDQQSGQRQVLDVIHQIFPRPVPYIDHAGMVATFRKVNIFMSTWGMDEYRRRGEPFMPPALRKFRPPLVLVNRSYLDVDSRDSEYLMSADRAALEAFYQPYWGPIRVAGARVELVDSEQRTVALPFAGNYRLESTEPVLVDGVLRASGEVVDVTGETAQLARQADSAGGTLTVRLLIAEAGSPPPEPAVEPLIFTGL